MTTTTTTQYSDISFTEHLADIIVEESRPRSVVRQLINHYSIAGKATGTWKGNRWNDPGQAVAGTEGTAFTTTTQLGTTAFSLSPTEGAIAMVLVTNDAVEERIPGMVSVAQLMQDGTTEQKVAAIRPEASMAGRMVDEKIENDLTALFSSLSRTAGTTTVNISLANFDTALLTLETGEDLPHEEFVASLDKQQWGDLRTEMLVTSGGVAGTLWQAQESPFHRGERAATGYKGRLLGVDVFTHGVGVRQTANSGADVVGAIFLRGEGAPEEGSGQYGCFCMVEGRPPVVTVEGDHRERGAEVQVNAKYAVGERVDNWGVRFVTDA